MSSTTKTRNIPPVLIILFTSLFACCHGHGETANHLVLFDTPPAGLSVHKATHFDIRTNFSGTVHMVESRDFRVVVNITAPSLGQAYDVSTSFQPRTHGGGMVLEVKQGETTQDSMFIPFWLFVILAVLSLIVAIITGVYAIQWYNIEWNKQDFSERKSFASSSHHGTVRSRNSIQLSVLQGDVLRPEDTFRGDEELRQVREMPEEEEAEALEMEQRKKLKFKEDSDEMSAENEDSDPQERNLTKSRLHSQSKTIHKELLKKSVTKKVAPPLSRRTQMGKYEGVPTNDTDDTDDDRDKTFPLRGGSDRYVWSSGDDLQVQMNGHNNKSTSSLSTFGRTQEKESNLRKSENDLKMPVAPTQESDLMQLVMADVHPGGKPVVVSITPRDSLKPSRPGNIYVPPSELKSASKLSTFGQRSSSNPTTAATTTTTTSTTTPASTTASSTVPTSKQTHSTDRDSNSKSSSPAPGVTHQDVTRNYQDSHWAAPGLLSMSDIPEDPHEDDQSGISGSQRSTSMYGSSEIFEPPEPGNTYYNLDSDIDIPPLDSDDNIWSDGGLPSPSPRIWSPRTEKGKTNDDIKLIPGALKSPGPNTGRLVSIKPRPNSSIILQSERSKSSTPSPAPKGKSRSIAPPPSYEEISRESNTAFEFPPPPNFLQTADTTSHGDSSTNETGDYVVIKHDDQDKVQQGHHQGEDHGKPNGPKSDHGNTKSSGGAGGSGGGKKAFLGPTYMNLTILSTLCLVTLATGVLGVLTNEETRVDITIFAPAHFFTNKTRVFFNELKDTEVKGLDNKAVLVYDVSKPVAGDHVTEYWHYPCNRMCPQGCDETWGECVCLKGYRLGPNGNCVDVNECMEGKAKCDKAAGCYNRKGSYDCICGEDFYGDGKSCRDCQQGCPKDHYEVQPCTMDRQKICKACTQSCRHGYYLAQSCGDYENALCRVCQPKCADGQFESRQCTNLHDRLCGEMTKLSLPDTSSNVMLEERSRVRSDKAQLEKLLSHYVGFSRYRLLRGTGFYVELTVRYINPTPHFLPVNLSQPFDLDLVGPSVLGSYAVQRYCPSPVPDYYIFSYKKHKNLTYKLRENGSIEACETHKQFGQFLDGTGDDSISVASMSQRNPKNKDSFVCAQPGSLTNNFVMDEDFFQARTKWVDKSKRCQRHSRACESCTTKCGTDMFSGDPMCAIDKDGKDDGVSPRLMTCYNCCVKRNCSIDCQDYHKRRCQPEQCLKGNLLEFSIKPSWDSSQEDKYFCHIQPVEDQKLLEMDYNVRHDSIPTPLYSSSIKLHGGDDWKEKGKMEYSDGILNLELDSGLKSIPNFLEGAISVTNTIFKVGSYKEKGSQFGSSRVSMDFVFLRPPTPSAIPHMPQGQQDCTNHDLDTMHLATNMENPYIQDTDMEALANGSLPFTVHHKSKNPEVRVTLNREIPLLKRLFSVASLKSGSFHGNLFNNGSHWVVNMSAMISQCPGYLRVQIQDPNNATKNIYDTDVVVFCPTTFNMTFALLTFDDVTMYKDLMVVIHDMKAIHHFRLYHTSRIEDKLRRKKPAKEILTSLDETLPYASKQQQEEPPKSQSNREALEGPEYPIRLSILIAIAGVIVLLLVLAILVLCFLPGIPETPMVKKYHPLFAIIYMVVQFVYSILISGSVFFFILIILTRPYVRLIHQHGQKGGVTSASTRLELLQLQRHLEKELARQDTEVDGYQIRCITDVKKIVDDMQQMHGKLLKSTSDIFEKHRLELLLEEQKIFVRQKLTAELQKYRDDYLKASTSILRRIRQDAAASYQNIQHNNTWLEGARFLHKAVGLFQSAIRMKGQTFMKWTGINVDESSLDIDLSFSLPALPRLDDIQAPPPVYKPPMKRDLKDEAANEIIRSIQVHNNWFFPLADSVLGAVSSYKPHQSKQGLSGRNEAAAMFYLFVVLLVICDLLLLAHRMTKAWTTAKLILFGFPEYIRDSKEDEVGGPEELIESRESNNKQPPPQSCKDSPWFMTVNIFCTQTISTTFLPKIVGAVAACVVLVCVLRLTNSHLTVDGLQRLGLYHNPTESVSTQIRITNSRIHAHASHINTMEYPSFQALTNAHLNTHKRVFGFYRRELDGLQNLTAQMYCLHVKAIGLPSNCTDVKGQKSKDDDLAWLQMEALTHACQFQPVMPELFLRATEEDNPTSEKQVGALLKSLRAIVYYTSHLISIFLIIIVVKELSFATVWILLKRSGVIRIRVIVEQDQGDINH